MTEDQKPAAKPIDSDSSTKASEPAIADHKANNFDFLRLMLSLMVLYSHCYPLLIGYEDDVLMRITQRQISFGMFAVNGFFAISGFLISLSWMRSKSTLDYVEKRFLRIYPGFFVVLLFDMFVVGPLSGVDLHAYFHNPATYSYLTMLLLAYKQLPGVFPHDLPDLVGEANGSLWTIRYEIVCYALVAVLGLCKLLRRDAVNAIWLVATALWLFMSTHYQGKLPFIGDATQFPRLAVFFLTGMVFALWKDRIRYSNKGIAACLALVVITDVCHVLWYALPLLQTYLLFAIAFHPRINLHNFGKKGDYSYGVYLYAFPVQQLLAAWFNYQLNSLVLFAVSLPITLILAYASWNLVERPALALKPSRRRPAMKLPDGVS
jgi:peptidoglycan/LPS O-acetylase OafA/YrhL